jgi:hypothetical protein
VTSPDPFGKEATLPQQRLLNRDEAFNDTLTTPAIRRKVGILLRALVQDLNSRREADLRQYTMTTCFGGLADAAALFASSSQTLFLSLGMCSSS